MLKNNKETEKFRDYIDYIDKTVGDVRAFRVGFPKYPENPEKDEKSARLRNEFNAKLLALPKEFMDKIYKKYNLGDQNRKD